MVRTASKFRWSVQEGEEATVTATTASATASSAWEGSKKMLSPTLITSKVIGGRAADKFAFAFEEGEADG